MKTVKQIPQTTVQACAKYHARRWTCSCPDRASRGGSYYDENTRENVCKHMASIRSGLIDQDEVKAVERGLDVAEYRAIRDARVEKALGIQPAKAQPKPDGLEWLEFVELDKPKPTVEELFARFI